jgi:hypothetical protein
MTDIVGNNNINSRTGTPYRASHIKRHRSTKAEVDRRRDCLFEIVSANVLKAAELAKQHPGFADTRDPSRACPGPGARRNTWTDPQTFEQASAGACS